ncbi:MAG: M1 family aminopeptidase [Ignavibacteriaceae bacterium]|nr:M1 family aminopeptidase [Ignavibacteriaceae bacterium]
MLNKILPIILILSALVNAQNEYKPWIKGERERYSKQIQLSKVMYPGDSKIDVTYYGLDLSITANPNYLTGNVIIGVKADTTSLNTCFLDLRNFLIIDSLLLNGTAAVYDHSNNKINITLDHTYSQGEAFTLRVYYHGVPGSSGFGGFLFGTHSGTPVISTLSESYSGPYWWPQKDTPADKADSSEVWITVDNNLTPVSNGLLEGIVDNGNGTHTYHWKERYAIAAYLISLAISNYTQYDTYYNYSPTDSMIITHFFYPNHFASYKQYADATAGMIEVFSNSFGQYPFIEERYGHAEFTWGGSMEHQTCTSMGFWGTGVVSHELAHQWYGDMITCKDWHHIWLNEGFATYAEAVYLEAINGQSAYNSQIQSEMNSARSAVGTIWVQDITNEGQIFNGARSYAKGACVLHMLRGIVGDSTIFDILRAYSDDPDLKYNAATTEDFQAVAESVSGQDLDYFFQEWIYGENEPTYTIGWDKSLVSGDLYDVTLNIYQSVNSNPSYFTMPVQVKLNTSLGDTIVTLFNNAQTQNFQFQVIGNPQSIVFDPGNWILKNNTVVTETEDLTIPLQFSLEQNYPNPFNPSTTIEYTIPQNGFVSLKIFNVLGKEVATLVNGQIDSGKQKVEFNATGLNSGVYFYRIESGSFVDTKKLILLK